eukprot:TRINITY_DN27821_c0_g1_i1.p1 TRINITY_DN27821_c0_g1~~TRINITY_DN27821_c0_g1_i1.p1  ORF type:complete len:277 (+),score=88.16 TRINITY_DN27821_c0_g1_i1:32-832(+)
MARGLPAHLQSFLRHKPPSEAATSSSSSKASSSIDRTPKAVSEPVAASAKTGKGRKNRAARERRKAKELQQREAEKEALAEEKRKLSAKRKKASAEAQVVDKPSEVQAEKPSKLKKKKKKKTVTSKSDDASEPKGISIAQSLLDDEEAAADEALIKQLESRLGFAGDAKKRKRAEQKIFAELLGDMGDVGRTGEEEPPSSDEDAQPPSDDEILGDETADGGGEGEDFSSLLESILAIKAERPQTAGKRPKSKGSSKPLSKRKKQRP